MATKSFKNLYESAKNNDVYWGEALKLKVATRLHELMDRKGISRAELARKLQTSPSYITKILGGDENLGLENLVRIARAAGGQVNVEIYDSEADGRWLEVFRGGKADAKQQTLTREWRQSVALPAVPGLVAEVGGGS